MSNFEKLKERRRTHLRIWLHTHTHTHTDTHLSSDAVCAPGWWWFALSSFKHLICQESQCFDLFSEKCRCIDCVHLFHARPLFVRTDICVRRYARGRQEAPLTSAPVAEPRGGGGADSELRRTYSSLWSREFIKIAHAASSVAPEPEPASRAKQTGSESDLDTRAVTDDEREKSRWLRPNCADTRPRSRPISDCFSIISTTFLCSLKKWIKKN